MKVPAATVPVAMPFCPSCREEYVPGIELCADCDVPLVETLEEPEPEPAPETPVEAPAGDVEAVVVAETEDESVANAIVESLLAWAIPARVVAAGADGPFRVEVPPEFEERAAMAASGLARRHDLDGGAVDVLAAVTGRLFRFLGAPDAAVDPLEALSARVSDRDREVVYAPRSELEWLGPEAYPSLVRALLQGRGALARDAASALVGLGDVGPGAAREALSEAIRHDIGHARRALTRALAEADVPNRADEVVVLASHDDPEVAMRAVRALGELRDPAAGPWIVARLRHGDDEDELREELADALWTLTDHTVDLEPNGDAAALEEALTKIERRYGWTSSS